MKKFRQLDLQDALVLVGMLCFIGGMSAIYKPAGLLIAGMFAFGFALLIERAKTTTKKGN